QAETFQELYDPTLQRFLPTNAFQSSAPDFNIGALNASLPENGAVGVPLDTLVALRFSKLLRPETVNTSTVSFRGPSGPIPARIVPAANGRLVFLTPQVPLAPSTTYTVTVAGVHDQQGLILADGTISFTTQGSAD